VLCPPILCWGSFLSPTLWAILCILTARQKQALKMLVLGTEPHPLKLFITFLMFQCSYFQVHTKFSVDTLFQFEVTNVALQHSGQRTSVRNHSMIPSSHILLEWEGHTSLHHQQPIMNLYLWRIFIFQFHYFLVTQFRLPSV